MKPFESLSEAETLSLLYAGLDNHPGILLIKDQNLSIIFANQNFCQRAGALQENIIGKKEHELFSAGYKSFEQEEQNLLQENGIVKKTYSDDYDGKEIVWKSVKFVINQNGKRYLFIHAHNLDEASKAEHNQLTNEMYLKAVVDYSDSAMAVLDTECRIKNFLGSDRVIDNPDIVFKTLIRDIIDSKLVEEVKHNVSTVIKTRKQLTVKKIISYQGQDLFLKDRYYPIKGEEDEIHEVGLVRQDISRTTEIQEAYQTIVNNSSIGLIIMQENRIVFTNKCFSEMCGYASHELLSFDLREAMQDMIPGLDSTLVRQSYEKIYESDTTSNYEFALKKKDGSLVWIQFFGTKIIYNGVPSIQAALLDITFRKQAEKRLEMFKHTLNSSIEQILYLDTNQVIQLVNKSVLTAFDKSEDEIIGLRAEEFFGNRLPVDLLEHYLEICYLNQTACSAERWISYPDGDKFIELSFFPYKESWEEESNTTGAVMLLRDITEMVQTDLKMIDVAENERRKIAMELHDGLTHELLGISIKAKLLMQKINSGDDSLVLDVKEINDLLNQSISFARNISKGISPIHEQNKKLSNMLAELRDINMKRYAIECTLQMDDSITLRDERILENLYYIIDESITNAVKHAKTQKVDILVHKKEGFLNISIRDYGKGFDVEQSAQGMGLKFIEARCRSISAALDISSNSKGTTVRCTLKL